MKDPFSLGEKNVYYMIHPKHNTIQKNKASTGKNEYQYICKDR